VEHRRVVRAEATREEGLVSYECDACKEENPPKADTEIVFYFNDNGVEQSDNQERADSYRKSRKMYILHIFIRVLMQNYKNY
jgi:hypothetical protein